MGCSSSHQTGIFSFLPSSHGYNKPVDHPKRTKHDDMIDYPTEQARKICMHGTTTRCMKMIILKKELYVTDGFTLRKYIKIYSYPSRHAHRHTVGRERRFVRSCSSSHSYNHHQVKMLLSESGTIQIYIYKATQMLVWLFNLCLSDRSRQINISRTFGSLNHTEKCWHSSKDTVIGQKREWMYIWMDDWM